MHGSREARLAVATFAAGLAVIVTGSVGLVLSRPALRPSPAVQVAAPAGPAAAIPWPSASQSASQSASRPAALPVSLTIPAIGVRTPLVHLGLTSTGTLQVPSSFAVAGWYDRGPRPGEIGPAVIAGHIDSVSGPAVFYRLGSLHPGDRAYVRRADGTLAVFRVTSVHLYPKDRFPTVAVYGPVPDPQLRLITCGGTFDPALHSYLSNVVVYAIEVQP